MVCKSFHEATYRDRERPHRLEQNRSTHPIEDSIKRAGAVSDEDHNTYAGLVSKS